MFKPILAAAAATSLVASPAMAASDNASIARTGASVDGESNFVGGGPIFALAMLAGVIAGAVILVVDDNDDDQPVSP